MLRAGYWEATLRRTALYKWIGPFREGREEVLDDEREGRPASAHAPALVAAVRNTIEKDRRQTLRDVASASGVSHESVRHILKEEFQMKKVAPKMVPRVLTEEQKLKRTQVCEDWISAEESDQILSRVITGDKSWIYEYDLEKKRSSLVWLAPREPRPKKARQSKSKIKAMLIVFFDCRGILMDEWVPPGQTVNGAYYLTIMQKLRDRIRKKRPDLWKNNSWILHHDNAPAHSCFVVKQYLAKTSTTVLQHPPYFPDLSPCDFFLFDRLKDPMRGQRLGSVEAIKQETAMVLKSFTENDFQACFQSWQRRWHRCIASGGEYFEGDHVDV